MSVHNHRGGKDLRQVLRARRRAIPPRQQAAAAAAVAERLATWQPFRRAGVIAAYRAFDGEIDVGPAMELAWSLGKQVCLPVVDAGASMRFRAVTPGAGLRRNRFGIQENRSGRWQMGNTIDLVLVPLVGFDAAGHRLGMGGGYYDRYFSHHLRHPDWVRGTLVGVAHAVQQTASLPTNPWDVPLDAIATECGLIRPGRSLWRLRKHRPGGSTPSRQPGRSSPSCNTG